MRSARVEPSERPSERRRPASAEVTVGGSCRVSPTMTSCDARAAVLHGQADVRQGQAAGDRGAALRDDGAAVLDDHAGVS